MYFFKSMLPISKGTEKNPQLPTQSSSKEKLYLEIITQMTEIIKQKTQREQQLAITLSQYLQLQKVPQILDQTANSKEESLALIIEIQQDTKQINYHPPSSTLSPTDPIPSSQQLILTSYRKLINCLIEDLSSKNQKYTETIQHIQNSSEQKEQFQSQHRFLMTRLKEQLKGKDEKIEQLNKELETIRSEMQQQRQLQKIREDLRKKSQQTQDQFNNIVQVLKPLLGNKTDYHDIITELKAVEEIVLTHPYQTLKDLLRNLLRNQQQQQNLSNALKQASSQLQNTKQFLVQLGKQVNNDDRSLLGKAGENELNNKIMSVITQMIVTQKQKQKQRQASLQRTISQFCLLPYQQLTTVQNHTGDSLIGKVIEAIKHAIELTTLSRSIIESEAIERFQQEKSELQREVNSLSKQLRELGNKLKLSQATVSQLNRKIQQLTSQNDQNKSLLTNFTKQNQELTHQKQHLLNQQQETTDKNQLLQMQIQQKQLEIQNYTKTITQLKTQFADQTSSNNAKWQSTLSKQATNFSQQLSAIQHALSKILNTKISLDSDPDRLHHNLSQLQITLKNYLSLRVMLSDSQIINTQPLMLQYLINQLQSYNNLSFHHSKMLYRFDPECATNMHYFIDGKEHILLLVKLQNGRIIGGYSVEGFHPEIKHQPGKGFIFSLTEQKVFHLSGKNLKLPVANYDKFYLIYGNSELRIKASDNKVFSNFGIMNSAFNAEKMTVDFLLGEGKEREIEFESYEIYQLIPNKGYD